MQTVLDIDGELLARAKSLAAQENITLERLLEEGLRLRLQPPGSFQNPSASGTSRLPVFHGKSGLSAAVKDPASHQSLLDAMEKAPGQKSNPFGT